VAAERHAAVLGRPVAHSLSPTLHAAAYRELGLSWRYHAIECDEHALAGVLAERAEWAGFSCTMPLKRAVLDVAGEVRATARCVGAGNTLLPRPGGGWIADNTDVYGILAALGEHGVAPRSVTLLGAGGTAQALVAALPDLGIARCEVLVRAPRRTDALRATAARVGVELAVAPLRADAPSLGHDLIVSTLPGDAADPYAGRDWAPHQALLDVRYDAWPTPLATAAQRCGAQVINGALMLLHQAARQVELMTGRTAPLEAMRDALRAARPGTGG
jgi:shikimate dehydrogenase